MQPYLIVIIIVCAVLVLGFAFALACDKIAFGRRCDKNPLLKYFTGADFGLYTEKIVLGKLNGAIYSANQNADKHKIIIFAHGMGPGHIAYTTEIAYFCKLGYTVVAVDSLGCNMSQGKNIKGMYQGAKTVIQVIDFVNEQFPHSKIYLIGHSWGAYSALCASRERKVDKVVSISAPDSPVKTICEASGTVISKPIALFLSPFWYLINLFKFGVHGNRSASSAVKNGNAEYLLIHGDRDGVVGLARSAYKKCHGDNVSLLLAKGKAHNPYNTISAEAKLAGLTSAMRSAKSMPEVERIAYFESFDYTSATEEDPLVMQAIGDFLEK